MVYMVVAIFGPIASFLMLGEAVNERWLPGIVGFSGALVLTSAAWLIVRPNDPTAADVHERLANNVGIVTTLVLLAIPLLIATGGEYDDANRRGAIVLSFATILVFGWVFLRLGAGQAEDPSTGGLRTSFGFAIFSQVLYTLKAMANEWA